jgi:hypothetical protein
MAKKQQYRLQVLYELREKAKKESEEFYAEAKKKTAEEEKKHQEMQQTLEDMIAHREAKKVEYSESLRSGGINIQAVQANDRHIDRLKKEEEAYAVEIDQQFEKVEIARAEEEEAMQSMLKATQDYKALEKHKEKWVDQVKKEIQAKEEDAAEDVAQAQYFARMMEERGEG